MTTGPDSEHTCDVDFNLAQVQAGGLLAENNNISECVQVIHTVDEQCVLFRSCVAAECVVICRRRLRSGRVVGKTNSEIGLQVACSFMQISAVCDNKRENHKPDGIDRAQPNRVPQSLIIKSMSRFIILPSRRLSEIFWNKILS